MKKILGVWLLILTALVATLFAQATGTPNTLRVITDASGYLVASIQAQTLPLSQPTIFSNTRLRTDASGYLLVAAATGGGYPALSGNAWEVLRGDGVFSATLPRGTITTSSPWTLTQTWNAAAVFNALNVTITRTNSSTLSSPLSTTLDTVGDTFGIYQDPTGQGASGINTKYSLALNRGLSGSSFSFALRAGANSVGITSDATGAGTRPVFARSFVSDTNFDSGTNKTLYGVDYGLKLIAALPIGWSSSSTDATTLDTGFNRDAAGVVAVTSGTASTYRDLRSRHLLGAGTAPAVTNTSANSCGTTAATLVGSDTAGKVTVGATSGTSCTVTFTAAFTNAPACSVSDETTAVLARATSTTTTVILAGVFTAADVLSYNCISY